MKSSIQILNDIQDIDEKVKTLSDKFNASEGGEQAAIHDSIVELNGRSAVLKEQLNDVLAEEQKIRDAGGAPIVAHHEKKPAVMDAATAYLGTRAEFDKAGGIQCRYGIKQNVSGMFRDAADTTHQFALETPTKKSYNLPENIIELPMGVIDTLAKGTTDSNLDYMVPGAFTNNAGLWTPGEVKAESDEKWERDQANLFTVAHHIPISKQTANHYGQLRSLISNDLMTGLRMKEAAYCLNLDNGAGEQGILKKPIQKYTAKKGEKFYSSVRRMVTASWMATGFRPDTVALHPLVREQLDLEQLSDGAYMNLVINNSLWALPVVEDVNLVDVTGEGDAQATTYSALVYNRTSATWYTSEADALTIGYVNDQFTRNEFTLLAEGEHLITVQRPKSFVFLADAITPGK